MGTVKSPSPPTHALNSNKNCCSNHKSCRAFSTDPPANVNNNDIVVSDGKRRKKVIKKYKHSISISIGPVDMALLSFMGVLILLLLRTYSPTPICKPPNFCCRKIFINWRHPYSTYTFYCASPDHVALVPISLLFHFHKWFMLYVFKYQ